MLKQITRSEWRKTSADYKSRIDGTPYVLDYVAGNGTCLVPVEIVPDPDEKPTIKAMREKIANAGALVCHDALLNPERTGTVYVIDKHQKNSLRTHVHGKAFWLSLDIIEPLDANTYAAIGTPQCPYPGEILGIYGIVNEATA